MKDKVVKFANNPKKALVKIAIPIIIGMLVETLYNIVDTAYVGRLGTDSIAALTFCFPIFFFIIAVNAGIGVGMNSRISRFIGSNHLNQADNTGFHGLILSMIYSLLLVIFGFSFLKPIFLLMGAASVLELSISYMSVILSGIFFMSLTAIFVNIFIAQGDTKKPMYIQISALLLNIILDPIFIFYLGYGVSGAAIATVISYTFASVVSFILLKYKSDLKLNLENFKLKFDLFKQIIFVGFPASLNIVLMSVYIIFFNKLMATFGTPYVASYGLVSRLNSIAILPIFAVSSALLTLSGIFYGAKRYELLKSTIFYGIKIALLFAFIIGTIFFIFPHLLLKIFTSDQLLLNLGASLIRVGVFVFPFMAIGMLISRSLQGMGYGAPALVVAVVRIIFVTIPLGYLFVFYFGFGYLSVPWATVIGGFASTITALIYFLRINKKINKKLLPKPTK